MEVLEALRYIFWIFLVTFTYGTMIMCFAVSPLQIAMIVIGAKYNGDCPVETMIPIYLIVAGAGGLFGNFYSCGMIYRQRSAEEQIVNPLQALIQLFLFGWFVCGNVWIYENYEPNYADPRSPDYCHKTLYLFAFWVTISYHIISVIILISGCCVYTFLYVLYIFKWSRKDYDVPSIFRRES